MNGLVAQRAALVPAGVPPKEAAMPKANQSRPPYAKILVWVAAGLGLLAVTPFLARELLKYEIAPTLRQTFGSDVQIHDLAITGMFHLVVTANGVVLTMRDRPGAPPLIVIERLTLSAGIPNLLRLHVSAVHLQGVQLRIPPRQSPSAGNGKLKPEGKIHFPLVVDELTVEDALLETLPSDARHSPHDFKIRQAVFHSFSFDRPASFQATLTNPKPIGDIQSQGQFGPWRSDQPGDTSVSGDFQYSHADFSSIRGLSGTMSSQGTYGGTIDHINVQGESSMPDFALAFAGNPMPLTTQYTAVVDGATGNTYLQSVHARLGSSAIDVQGEIAKTPGQKGTHITLTATSNDARLQDFLHLVVKGAPPLDGTISLRAKIDLPPTSEQKNSKQKPKDAPPSSQPDPPARSSEDPPGNSAGPNQSGIDLNRVDTMTIVGQFGIDNARFTQPDFEHKLDSLSRAGQGQPKNLDVQDTIFNLRGHFDISQAIARLSQIDFQIPGAQVQLRGSYGLQTEGIDFHGLLLLDAKLADATTGVKSVLLRVLDPFFKREGGGSSIPFKITGDRLHPHYGLDRGGK
jgi:hypothetical protein